MNKSVGWHAGKVSAAAFKRNFDDVTYHSLESQVYPQELVAAKLRAILLKEWRECP
jgi:hypothetical protein